MGEVGAEAKRTRASGCTEKTRERYTQGCLGAATATPLSLSLSHSFVFISSFSPPLAPLSHPSRTVPGLPFRQTPRFHLCCPVAAVLIRLVLVVSPLPPPPVLLCDRFQLADTRHQRNRVKSSRPPLSVFKPLFPKERVSYVRTTSSGVFNFCSFQQTIFLLFSPQFCFPSTRAFPAHFHFDYYPRSVLSAMGTILPRQGLGEIKA